MPKRFFNMGEGERIVKEIKPLPSLRTYFILTWTLGLLFVVVWFIWMPFFLLPFIGSVGAVVVLIVLFVIILILANKRYKHQHYWLTNERVIYKRGIIGYRVTSIPYERISDVIISRTFLEKIFGFGSLHIQTLAGQISGKTRLGSEGVLLAIPSPEETQELVFKLIKLKRKKEKITF